VPIDSQPLLDTVQLSGDVEAVWPRISQGSSALRSQPDGSCAGRPAVERAQRDQHSSTATSTSCSQFSHTKIDPLNDKMLAANNGAPPLALILSEESSFAEQSAPILHLITQLGRFRSNDILQFVLHRVEDSFCRYNGRDRVYVARNKRLVT